MGEDINKHLAGVGDWGADFRCTPLVIDIFAKRNIFFDREATRFAGHEIMRFEKDVVLEPYTSFNVGFSLWSMGSFSYAWSHLPDGISVGRYCSIAAWIVMFYDRHPVEWATTSSITYEGHIPPECPDGRSGYPSFLAAHRDFNNGAFPSIWPPRAREPPLRIENDVWLGQNTLFARNITIGTGAVVAAGAVVTKNVPPYMIVGGVPARSIRPRFSEHLIERFLRSKWWEYDPGIFKRCDYTRPEKFLDDLEELKAKTAITPFMPEKITYKHILNDLVSRTR